MDINIRQALLEDLDSIVEIYNSTVASRLVTADIEPVTVESRQEWFQQHTPERPLWVGEDADGNICGWVSFNTFYGRAAYKYTAEVSIYVHEGYRGKKIGHLLLETSIQAAPSLQIKNLLGFIFGQNVPSVKLFEKFGFEQWGMLPGVASFEDGDRDLVILGRKV
ncbi:N-acetyltransferase family protein [Metabacillus sp. GX 13764]|uniref:GNAT family N-acetyltransferase n=1 Tax=Metabacillus kandeliae TaxID=2900151 RepID=UPI001E2AD154|nr:GNAT family N-acetyltransferase [Metabacillus kandeliae]MCD7034639.1 N-acetyltransferase family protein [Metabacillus kandeliae]